MRTVSCPYDVIEWQIHQHKQWYTSSLLSHSLCKDPPTITSALTTSEIDNWGGPMAPSLLQPLLHEVQSSDRVKHDLLPTALGMPSWHSRTGKLKYVSVEQRAESREQSLESGDEKFMD
jgi:hypothetical protein